MVFNSLDFLVFLVVVYSAYLVLPHKKQNLLLLCASYFFYGYWDWRFLSLLFISTVVDYYVGSEIEKEEKPERRKRLLFLSCFVNLSFLGFFKYFNFFIESANAALEGMGVPTSSLRLNIVLPIGISFYTFQTMTYTIDIYRRQLKPIHSFLDFALYVAFFPQLVAGPIERASRLLPQIQTVRTITREGLRSGLWLMAWGLFKKMVIADNMAGIADAVYGGEVAWNLLTVLLGTYAFALQIYCDFSGYSDIARGVSKVMGFDLMVNFRNPYFALNPSDFWRRWHISLSTWLRDYLYIPLGGNKKGSRRTYMNLMLTMILGGLWHGAAWTFVFWGIFHGGLLALHRLFRNIVPAPQKISTVKAWMHMILMFHATCFGWMLFRAQSMDDVIGMLASMTTWTTPSLAGLSPWIALGLLWLPLWLVQIVQERTHDLLAPLKLSLVPRTAIYTVIIIGLLAFANTGSKAFIYFQF